MSGLTVKTELVNVSPTSSGATSPTSPTWKIPKALYSSETYVIESSVLPSPVRKNNGVSGWSKQTSPRFEKSARNTCQTQYDLHRAEKYLTTKNGSVMLGAPRVNLARKLDSHTLGNMPDFLRKVKSFNVKGAHMAGGGHDSNGSFLPSIIRPKRTVEEVQQFIQHKRKLKSVKRQSSSIAITSGSGSGTKPSRRKRKSHSNIKPRYLGYELPKKVQESLMAERQAYATTLLELALKAPQPKGLRKFIAGADTERRQRNGEKELRPYANLAPATAGLQKLGIFLPR